MHQVDPPRHAREDPAGRNLLLAMCWK